MTKSATSAHCACRTAHLWVKAYDGAIMLASLITGTNVVSTGPSWKQGRDGLMRADSPPRRLFRKPPEPDFPARWLVYARSARPSALLAYCITPEDAARAADSLPAALAKHNGARGFLAHDGGAGWTFTPLPDVDTD